MNKKISLKRKAQLLITALVFIFSGAILLSSCDEDTPAPASTIQLDKHGAVDMNVRTKHLDGLDILIVEKIIYDETGNVTGKKYSIDTMKRLSIVADTLSTGRTYEDENGDNQEIDTIVHHPKNYQIYITVK